MNTVAQIVEANVATKVAMSKPASFKNNSKIIPQQIEANGTTTKNNILPLNLLKGIPDITYYMKSGSQIVEANVVSKLATFEQKVAKDARRFLLVSNSLQLLNYFQEVEAYSNYLRESVGHYFQKTVASRRKVVLDFEADTVSKVSELKVINCPIGVQLHFLPKAKKPETPKKPPLVAKVVDKDVVSKFWKFPVKKNDKTPICKWRDAANHTKTSFNPLKLNTGVPTGSINNLLVVDIDVKDFGLDEFQKYVLEHGIPNTLAVETPSGGFHYYFNYASANPEDEFYIKNYLKNSSKYRGVGIDIRSDGGYIVAPPSIRKVSPTKLLITRSRLISPRALFNS